MQPLSGITGRPWTGGWSVWPVMNKAERVNTVFLLILFVAIQLAGQLSSGLSGRASSLFNIFTLVTYGCLALRFFVWILILKRLPLITAYPFTGIIYILILPLSCFMYHKPVEPERAAGMVMIFAGIVLCSLGSRRNKAGNKAKQSREKAVHV